ncbi:pseudouridine synthase [Actinomyces naeslundii]|uniref:pseudouridine synthase n=1 Tax=Actinomyces naeslundii TaxID=1655 RepID=UPI00096BF4FA|nr:pseudouridine synthase [Actinomyces naeslundii]OMG10944.1 pseudouridine synthase [Actinomyces naeslundii]
MSETARTNAHTLREASTRLRRILSVAAVVLVAGEVLWCLIGGARGAVAHPLGTLLAAAGSTTVLLAATWWFLDRMVRSGMGALVAWMAGGYLGKVAILAVALLGGRALGCDTRVIGLSLIAAILVGMFAEATVLAQARILAVEPKRGGLTDRS